MMEHRDRTFCRYRRVRRQLAVWQRPTFGQRLSRRALLPIVGLVFASCSGSSPVVSDTAEVATTQTIVTAPPTTTTTAAPTTTTTEAPDPVDLILASFTTEQKIGQLLMPVVSGTAADAASSGNERLGAQQSPSQLVEAFHLGGVLYLGPNIVDAAQLSAFSAGLQAVSEPSVGLLVAVDQEGGRVQRVTDGVTRIPSARSLAGDAAQAEAIALQSAVELRAQGINTVFAPVADLVDGNEGVIRDRSYGSDPDVVADMVVATINGLERGGVAAAAKHWPGHGATTVDSHKSLPVLDVSPEVWMARERVPFAAAVQANVDMIMVGHLSMPQLDPSGEPATHSPILVEQLLRNDLDFAGVIVSDALDMGALAGEDRGEIAVQSLLAGIDLLLAPPDLVAVQQAILEALASGRLTEARLDASVSRVLTMKLGLGLIDVATVTAQP